MSFLVRQCSGQAIVVDCGRHHAQHDGLSQSGPLDEYSFLWANRLLNNAHDCAMLEITLGRLQLQAQRHIWIALTGADIPVHINGVPVPPWSSVPVRPNDQIDIGFFQGRGTRVYLAVAGGLAAPDVYGSKSCVLREQLGGHNQGRAVQQGDVLSLAAAAASPAELSLVRYRQAQPNLHRLPLPAQPIRFIPSYQYAEFSQFAQDTLVSDCYQLTAQIDRMGFRLQGPALPVPDLELRSEGIALGSIQITREGQPIVLMSDRQSIGGYLKIGVVYRVDLGRLAQGAPGQSIRFVKGSLDEAWQLQQQRHRFFSTPLT